VVALAAATAALLLTGTVTAPADADTPSQVTLPDPNPGPAPSGGIAANAALTIPLRVYLTGRNPKREAATALAVSDRRGPAYAHYLTPDRFQQVFGPSAAQVDEVSDWLTSEGIKITATSYHYITVSATVARVDAALDTQITAFPIPIQ
jgi:subtilase family serine protease